jgi:hypothetical protein
MRKTIFFAAMFTVITYTVAFAQNSSVPGMFGLGVSLGQMGNGTESFSADLTSPYLRFAEYGFLSVRVAADVLGMEGIPVGGTTYVWIRPSHYSARIGVVLGQLPNEYLRIYRELGGLMVIPTVDVASAVMPSWGIYVQCGVEFLFTQKTQSCLFAEIGDEVTLTNSTADKLQGAPSIGNGVTVTAGWRYYF